MSEWRPIETAPKDGVEFLAYDSRTKKFDVAVRVKNGAEAVQYDGEFGPSSDEFGHDPKGITHWMPLPAPPTSEA